MTAATHRWGREAQTKPWHALKGEPILHLASALCDRLVTVEEISRDQLPDDPMEIPALACQECRDAIKRIAGVA
jgi:hypothetical protein